jgi:hypothetical protein
MLSRGRMIWLLGHPLYPPLSSVTSAGDTQEDCERETTLLTGGGMKGADVEPNHPTARKAGPL